MSESYPGLRPRRSLREQAAERALRLGQCGDQASVSLARRPGAGRAPLGARVGLPPNFSIYDASDQNRVVKEAIEALDLSATNFTPSTIHGTISNAKNQLNTADTFARDARDFYSRTVSRVFTKYDQLLHKNNALDFDDLLLRTAFAMRDHRDMLAELQERFPYLMIDEYQDTNHAQYVIAHALAQRSRKPDQELRIKSKSDAGILG